MFTTLAAIVAESERLVRHAASLTEQLRELTDGCRSDGMGVASSQDMQQGQPRSAHAYHLGNSVWRNIHDHVRERETATNSIRGLEGSGDLPETICELGRTLGCEQELGRWENEGGSCKD